MLRRSQFLPAWFAFLTLSLPAFAETPVEAEARDWYEKGKTLYQQADYASAFVAFRTSYRLAPRAALLFNIAQALRLSGSCSEAVGYYKRYREQVPDLAQGFDEAFDKALDCARTEAPPGDAATPVEAAKPHPDGKVEPEVTRTPETHAPEFPPAAAPNPSVAPAPPNEPRSWTFGRTLGVSLVAFGGVSAVGAVVGVVESHHASEQTTALSQRGGPWDGSAQSNEDAGRRWANWSIVLAATSGVSIGTGLWLLLRPESSRSIPTVAAMATPHGATVSWSGSF